MMYSYIEHNNTSQLNMFLDSAKKTIDVYDLPKQ